MSETRRIYLDDKAELFGTVDEIDERNGLVSEPVDFTEAAVAQLEAEEPVDEPDVGIFD